MAPKQRRPLRLAASRIHLTTAVVAGLAIAFGSVPAVSAHVDVDVGDGQYVMEVGFRDEPAFQGQPNAVYVHVEEYATGGTEPVDGLAATLTIEVTKDEQTFSPALVPSGDGSYEAVFVPTALGDYTFRITGTIGEATVDESVTSGPSTFNSVEPLSVIEFPAVQPDGAGAQASIEQVQAEAAMARTLGIVGIVAGLLGLIVAAVAFSRSGKSAPRPEPAPAPVSESPGKLIR